MLNTLMILTDMLRERQATFAGLVTAVCILGLSSMGVFDPPKIGVLVAYLSRTWIDELIAALLLVLTGIFIDQRRVISRVKQEAEIQAHRLRVLKATMRTVQDIVNNFLNNMQIVELEVGDALSPQTLELLETIRQETFNKLKVLGDLESTPEISMTTGPGINCSKQ